MKIGFDVSDLATNRADGTTRYTRELAARMPALAPNTQWSYFAAGEFSIGSPLPANVTSHVSAWPKFWTQLRLPVDLLRVQPNVLFMPIQQLPIVRPRGMKTVAVIHDLACHLFPQQFTYKDWALLHIFTPPVAREADAIIAVSQSTADDIATYYGRTNNVHVIHHGVNHEKFRLPTEAEKQSSHAQVVAAYPALQKPYLLYVGQIQPRKNLIRLIEAFEIIAQRNTELQLVIVGGHGWKQQDILDKVASSPVTDRILMTGPVVDDLLIPLYWNAAVFTLVSLYEGFGMPVLEALACGVQVVTSNVSSLPEIAGSHAVLVNPYKSEDIARGIQEVLSTPTSAALLSAHAQTFNWDRCARQTLDVLQG